MLVLKSVYDIPEAATILYELLKERTPEQSISHRSMPTIERHLDFVNSRPYVAWFLIWVDWKDYVGAIYLTQRREVGIHIFKEHQHKGYATQALRQLMSRFPGKLFANVNPKNEASKKFFESNGAKLIQETYAFGE